ncbi:MAG TPA: WxcM-like domain-containing protein [Flavobacteriaceae bacterium]|nr:WxcM-like domain-containing protein [Flavobacteriaceae bacterium]
MEESKLFQGNSFNDERGTITFNNDFDLSKIKRIYTIENRDTEFIRGWQGHEIEERWFACISGSFEIGVREVHDFEQPYDDKETVKYILDDETLTYLHIPKGHITAIKANEPKSKLLVLADHHLGEVKDEYRYPLEQFPF